MTNRAHHAAFKSKVLALVDVLKLDRTEVIGLALALAVSFGTDLSRQEFRSMLEAALDQTRGPDEVQA